jgi:cytochrome c-type biogenesis protein CcmH/NrfG
VKARIAAIVMAVVLVIYLVFVVQYSFVLIGTGVTVAIIMGCFLLVLPIIAAWLLWREVQFVLRGERLVRVLGDAGELPVDDLPRRPSGRPDTTAADAQFPAYQVAVEENPGSWRAWLLLGLAYDASGDRSRARWATREAIKLERAAR